MVLRVIVLLDNPQQASVAARVWCSTESVFALLSQEELFGSNGQVAEFESVIFMCHFVSNVIDY